MLCEQVHFHGVMPWIVSSDCFTQTAYNLQVVILIDSPIVIWQLSVIIFFTFLCCYQLLMCWDIQGAHNFQHGPLGNICASCKMLVLFIEESLKATFNIFSVVLHLIPFLNQILCSIFSQVKNRQSYQNTCNLFNSQK